jgi:hypothetical protein
MCHTIGKVVAPHGFGSTRLGYDATLRHVRSLDFLEKKKQHSCLFSIYIVIMQLCILRSWIYVFGLWR